MAEPNTLADKLGELGESLAKIQDTVQQNAADFMARVEKGAEVSAELKEKTDKSLSELGSIVTRVSDLEKQVARENAGIEDAPKSLGELVLDSQQIKDGTVDSSWRGAFRVRADRALRLHQLLC